MVQVHTQWVEAVVWSATLAAHEGWYRVRQDDCLHCQFYADIAQLAERILGKDEVPSSNLGIGSYHHSSGGKYRP